MQNVVAGSSKSNDNPFSLDEDIEETEKNEACIDEDDEEEEEDNNEDGSSTSVSEDST